MGQRIESERNLTQISRLVNTIAGRLSLRPPQRESLEILHRVTEILPPAKERDLAAALEVIQCEYPHLKDFDRNFPSFCFALATGVGKTRLMGAFITYLHLAHGINNYFFLAPNLTIYNKLITDFTPNTPKYVFRGIAEFSTAPPEIITGDNYESRAGDLLDSLVTEAGIFLCEPKARDEMSDVTVIAKRDAAVEWCLHATKHALENEGMAWTYALIPHDAIQTNKSLKGLVDEFGVIQEP